jgi:hypothetical protein
MSIGLLFWILMVLWFFSWMGSMWDVHPWAPRASAILLFVLLFLLGWGQFGFVIHQ